MPKKLGILVVHGMGAQNGPGFADDTIKEVNKRVKKLGQEPKSIAWKPGYWANILQPKQDALLAALRQGGELDCISLRKFVISNLGDAVAYQRKPEDSIDVYQQIHAAIQTSLAELRQALGKNAPLVVMAHSLGSCIMSNYIWDQQKQNSIAAPVQTNFERMKTLAGFVTFGSNIPVFSLALQKYDGIDFPAKELPQAVRARGRWLNFYDPQDILGFPIKPLCPEYQNNAQIEDRAINAGGIFTSWNPLSHQGYWTDNDFTKPVATLISNLLRVI